MIETTGDNEIREKPDVAYNIAAAFRSARLGKTALCEFPGTITSSLADSYKIQDRAIESWPDVLTGWKVGRILGDQIDIHGVDRLIGPIFQNSTYRAEHGQTVEIDAIIGGFCAVEAEFVFELNEDAVVGKTDYDAASALDLVRTLWTGIEIAGSPLANINQLGPLVVVSDFGNNWGLIIGQEVQNWRERLLSLEASMAINETQVGSGKVSAFPGGIAQSLAFALNCAGARGLPLKKNMFVSTGAVSGVHDAVPGDYARADFGTDGSINCKIVLP